MTLQELLAKIEADLKALGEREGKGEQIAAGERETLEAHREAIAAAIEEHGGDADVKTPEQELEELRAWKQSRELQDVVAGAARTIVDEHRKTQATLTTGVAALIEKAVREELGTDAAAGVLTPIAEDAVSRALKTVRRPSRYAGPNSPEDLLKTLADGGSIEDVGDDGRTSGVPRHATPRGGSGSHRGVQKMMASKNLLVLMGAVYRNAKGFSSPFGEGADQAFLRSLSEKAMALNTASAGGYMVPQEWMDDVLEILRAQAVIRAAGPRVQGFSRQMNQTSVSGGATAFYAAENAPITLSEMTFADAPLLTPKYLTGMVAVSNYLLLEADEADDTVRRELTTVLGLKEDLSFLEGTGGTQPLGMRNIVGTTLNPLAPGANGFQPTLIDFRRLKARVRRLRTPGARWHAFFAPELITRFETLTDSTGRFLADAGILTYDENTGRGTLDGVGFSTSEQIPTNLTMGTSTDVSYLILVNMSDLIVGESKELSIDVSSEAAYQVSAVWHSAFQERQTLFRADLGHDLAHRRPGQVIVQEGVRTTA